MEDFLLNNYSVITKSVELIAAVFGTLYLKKNKNSVLKIFVYYLWLTFFVELIGEYSEIMQNNYDYSWYISFKNSVFCTNSWLYNIYSYLAIGMIGIFYSNMMSTKTSKIIIRTVIITYSLFVLIFFTITDAFFTSSLPYDMIFGTIIICIYVILYFIELMRNDEILEFYKLPSFYVSIGLLMWYICVMPLFIYDGYFKAINTNFIKFRYLLLLIINIFTYLCFAFGFWYALYSNKR
ncbi:hypothetical protein [uncultured Psychroserpens sp.]|uniref:hypothetical protein n=1 Tax=uncultured Psychroserpens sp. TaxID=255436 RepID=UPI0026231FF9|nr:hypothetical protein [uncultured Psychroserpens sp.]